MGGLGHQNTRLTISFLICLFIYIQSSSAQEGFVSIKCCAKGNVTEPTTNTLWIGDESWYPDYHSCKDIKSSIQKDTVYDKTRVFTSDVARKWCYNLTTEKGQNYLLRGTFLPQNLQRTSNLGTFFRVSVDTTEVGLVNSSNVSEVEVIFKASKGYVNFCLLRDRGEPYISKLEIRPLSPRYLSLEPSSVLKLVNRVDAGNQGGEVRYPLDQYDRIWKRDSYTDPLAKQTSSFTANLSNNAPELTVPPIQVLQTALSHPERLELLYRNLDPGYYKYDLFLYFLELNDSVQAGQRVFDVYLNDEKRVQVDIVLEGSRSYAVVLNITANGHLNLTMVKASNGSQLGPMINAYEILQVYPIQVQDTVQKEVSAIMDMKNELLSSNSENELLRSWSGDPCLPVSWPGLFCQLSNGSSIITKINLASFRLDGQLPASFTKLTHLKELNMSGNYFTGAIPGLSTSFSLTSMDISHNNLRGDITDLVNSLPNLTTLYFGCNPGLKSGLPSNLNTSKLATDKGMCGSQASTRSVRGVVIGAVAGCCLLVALAVGTSLVCIYRRKMRSGGKLGTKGYPVIKNAVFSMPSSDIVLRSISIRSFTLHSIEVATQKYKSLVGEGGFGCVYRGTLPDGQEVAVKVRSATSTQGTREFDNELNLLSAIRHENLVPLLGYCCENDQQILIYPFMSNGSLQDRLYGEAAKRKTLDWPTRLSIALGAARGLTYLHTFSERCVIHRDVKSSNILLDQSMTAKVADFGFSKYAPQEGDSGTSLEVRGTAGYLDPEYYSTQHLSAKSDVFSFGVVLLEIVSGREPLNIKRPRNEWSLVEWAKPRIRNSRIEEIVDLSIKGGYHAEAMWRVLEVALACIEPYSAYRPCMVDIVRELEDALIIENNASEYMKSIDSFGGSNRYSIERPIVILPTPVPSEPSPLPAQPPPPQPR